MNKPVLHQHTGVAETSKYTYLTKMGLFSRLWYRFVRTCGWLNLYTDVAELHQYRGLHAFVDESHVYRGLYIGLLVTTPHLQYWTSALWIVGSVTVDAKTARVPREHIETLIDAALQQEATLERLHVFTRSANARPELAALPWEIYLIHDRVAREAALAAYQTASE